MITQEQALEIAKEAGDKKLLCPVRFGCVIFTPEELTRALNLAAAMALGETLKQIPDFPSLNLANAGVMEIRKQLEKSIAEYRKVGEMK